MLCLEPAQCGFGVETVHVDNEDAGRRPGSDGDVVVGLLLPPRLDDVRVGGGVLRGRWPLPAACRAAGTGRREIPVAARAKAVRITARLLSQNGMSSSMSSSASPSAAPPASPSASARPSAAAHGCGCSQPPCPSVRRGRIELERWPGQSSVSSPAMAATASQLVMLSGSGFAPSRKYRTVFFLASSPLPSVSVGARSISTTSGLPARSACFQVLGRENFVAFRHV